MLQYVMYTKWNSIAKGIANFNVNNGFWSKTSKTQQQQNKKQTLKSLSEPGIEPGTFGIAFWCVTSRPPSYYMNICRQAILLCDAMSQNINKQICRPLFLTNFVFYNILTCMNNYIW